MNRRNFLGSLLAFPLAVKSLPLNDNISNINVESEALTKDFFHYISWNPTEFKWKKMTHVTSVFDGIPVIAKDRFLSTRSYPPKYYELDKDTKTMIIKSIIFELEDEFSYYDLREMYFYDLSIYPLDEHDSHAFKAISIRYAKISNKTNKYPHLNYKEHNI